MQIKKIITHAGQFHADEVLVVALLNICGINVPVERKFQVNQEELDDPEILVVDVARVYNEDKGNFDHHQDVELSASNILVADWLTRIELIPVEVRAHLDNFFSYVSDVDRGIIPNGGISSSFNGIIRSMNPADPEDSTSAFDLAVSISKQILVAQISVANRKIEDIRRWRLLERIAEGRIAIQEESKQIIGWKSAAESEGVKFLVTPSLRGGWQIISRDSAEFMIPVDSRQTFRHASGFIAVYDSRVDAVNHASEII